MARIEWFGEQILGRIIGVAEKTSKEVAENVMKDAKSLLKRNAKTTTEQGLLSQFYIEKSKFKNGGYLVYNQGPKKWRKPHHAAPLELGSWVHPYGNKKLPKVYLQPKPFMKPAVSKGKQRKARKLYIKNIDKEMAKP